MIMTKRLKKPVVTKMCLVLFLLIGVWLGWKGWRIYTLGQAFRDDVQTLQQMARGNVNAETLADVQPLLASARQHATALRSEAAPFLPLTRQMGWVPTYGADLVAARPLLDVAIFSITAAEESLTALVPLAHHTTHTPSLSEALVLAEELEAARPQLEQARAASTQALAAWEQVPHTNLSPQLTRYTQHIEHLLPVLDAGIALAIAADEFADPLLPIVSELEQTQTLSTTLIGPLNQARPQIERARPTLAQAQAAWARIPADDLPPSLQSQVARIAPLLPLLDASVDLVVAADEAIDVLAPVLQKSSDPSVDNSELLAFLGESRPHIDQAQEALTHAREQWAHVPLEDLPAPLQPHLNQMSPMLAQAQDGLSLARMLPDLLGAHGTQTYVFIAQNPDELRASGGFISAVGELIFYQGELEDFWLDNTDSFPPNLYPPPPEPFERYMNIPYWVFRDANWSPDFPAAAEMLRSLYQLERGERPANMIAFTPTAIQYILEATGPVSVEDVANPGSSTLVSAASLEQYIQDQYNTSASQGVHRKAFLEPVMEAIIERLQSDTERIDALAVGRAVLRALNERHLLITVREPDTARQLARQHWDGSVQPGTHDFLMAVDSNMGYTKANFYVQQAMTYTVDLRNPAAPEAELIIQHTHTFPEPHICQHIVEREPLQPGEPLYVYHTRQCYWDYLRVLVPRSSQLLNIQTQPVPAAWNLSHLDSGTATISRGVADTSVIGTFLIVPPGETRETVLRYRLPPDVLEHTTEGWHYRLTVQKQAGREAIPVVVQLRLPAATSVMHAAPALDSQREQHVIWRTTLATDQVFDIVVAPEHDAGSIQQPHGITP
jgi:hypothetical protein